MLERCPKEGYLAGCVTVRDANLFEDLGLITAPTLILTGEHDVPTPPSVVQELSMHIKGSRFELIMDAGHVPPLEQPTVLARHIRTHLLEISHA
jgi:3-oxoadipate enol-lactonase